MLTPLLTEADPATTSEGSIDPLGLYAIADALAVRLVPGVRERQSHPRFLTAIAVSLAICSEFDDEAVAADGVSEPWQVFEWYVVEGLVREISNKDQLTGLPGRDKTADAIRDGVPLSANRYLKTPSVFGFHGVYRMLSRTLGIEVAGRLGELGYNLLTTWAEEQGLDGFCGTAEGPGATWRRTIAAAVRDGLEQGGVARKAGWAGWQFFKDHLSHHNIGRKEKKLITQALLDSEGGFRRPVVEFLVSGSGRDVWQESESERRFHTALASRCDSSLQELLQAITTYETYSRILQDAFDDCLFAMSRTRGRTSSADLQSLRGVIRAAETIPQLFSEVIEVLAPFGYSIRFQESFISLAERLPTAQWVECLLEHHIKVQRGKPPQGKAPWYERFDDESYIIRPGYVRDTGGRHDEEYPHAFRTESLWSFAVDLGMVG